MIKNINPAIDKPLTFDPYNRDKSGNIRPISNLPISEDVHSVYDFEINKVYYCSIEECGSPALMFLGYAFKNTEILKYIRYENRALAYYIFKDAKGNIHEIESDRVMTIFTNKQDYIRFIKTDNNIGCMKTSLSRKDLLVNHFPLGINKKGSVTAIKWDKNSSSVKEVPLEPMAVWIDINGYHAEFANDDITDENLYFNRNECVNDNLVIDDDFSKISSKKDKSNKEIAYIIKGKQKDIMELLTHTKGNIKISGVEE